jgi:hypothetical protein
VNIVVAVLDDVSLSANRMRRTSTAHLIGGELRHAQPRRPSATDVRGNLIDDIELPADVLVRCANNQFGDFDSSHYHIVSRAASHSRFGSFDVRGTRSNERRTPFVVSLDSRRHFRFVGRMSGLRANVGLVNGTRRLLTFARDASDRQLIRRDETRRSRLNGVGHATHRRRCSTPSCS